MTRNLVASDSLSVRFQQFLARLLRSHLARQAHRPTAPCSHGTRGSRARRQRAVLAGLLMLGLTSLAPAFTAPATGDFGYDVYDIVVNQILNGPIGFIGGLFLIVFGATQIMKNWILTILCIIAGTVLIRAEALVVTLGGLVP